MIGLALVHQLTFSPILGYTPMIGESGTHFRLREENPWKSGPYLPLAGNFTNRSGISSQDLYTAVIRGLQRWQQAANGAFSFDYWQGENKSTYATSLEYDGLSSIFFASAAMEDSQLMQNAIAYTQLWIDPVSQEILEVDIVLNDIDFEFTTDPQRLQHDDLQSRIVLLENVITHELGHALGLDHSGTFSATMFAYPWFDQQHLHCDDAAGIRTLYAADLQAGMISGEVWSTLAKPLLAVQVSAISAKNAHVYASTLTREDGRFTLDGLPEGDYYVMIEPFYGGGKTLSDYYKKLWHKLCGSSFFSRTFVREPDHEERLQMIHVQAQKETVINPVQVTCAKNAGADVPEFSSTTEVDAPELFVNGQSNFAIVDQVGSGLESHYYRLSQFSGDLKVRILSQSLFSRVKPTIHLLDQQGQELTVQLTQPMLTSASIGYDLWEVMLIAQDLPLGDYMMKIKAELLDDTAFPYGRIYADITPFVMLLGQREIAGIPSGLCQQEEQFTAYTSPAGGPLRENSEAEEQEPRSGCRLSSSTPANPSIMLLIYSFIMLIRKKRD